DTVRAFGGVLTEFLSPFANPARPRGIEAGLHFDDTAETDATGQSGTHPTWQGMDEVLRRTRQAGRAPLRLGRSHYLVWTQNDALGRADATAQARLLQRHGVELDATFVSFP